MSVLAREEAMKPIPAQAGTETSPAVTVFATASENTGAFLRGLSTSAESGENGGI